MTLANKFTIARIILVPVFAAMAAIWGTGLQVWIAVVFIIASLTDTIDGQLARRYNQISDFGKLVDPVADKLLSSAAMLILVEWGRLPAIIAMAFIIRDHIMSGIRILAAGGGTVIAASWAGKAKTLLQMFAFIFLLLDIRVIGYILLGLATVMTLWSVVEYIIGSMDVIKRSGAIKFTLSFLTNSITAILVLILVQNGSIGQMLGLVFIGVDIIVSGLKMTKANSNMEMSPRISGMASFIIETAAFILLLTGSGAATIFLWIAAFACAVNCADHLASSRSALVWR